MIQRVYDLYPKPLVDALLPLGRMEPPWLYTEPPPPEVENADGSRFVVRFRTKDVPRIIARTAGGGGHEWLGDYVLSRWLAHGPKICQPSPEICAALAHVEVRLQLDELTFPYPEILVVLPAGVCEPFRCVLLGTVEHVRDGRAQPILVGSLHSPPAHLHDVISLVQQRDVPGWTVDATLGTFHDSCREYAPTAHSALRVAVNSCLMLSGSLDYLLPKEVASDRRLAAENSERGRRARVRLALALRTVAFDQTITFRRTEHRKARDGEGTPGREMPCHWRRGHWRMQPCGAGRAERKRILIPPVLVRSDLLDADASETCVSYKEV